MSPASLLCAPSTNSWDFSGASFLPITCLLLLLNCTCLTSPGHLESSQFPPTPCVVLAPLAFLLPLGRWGHCHERLWATLSSASFSWTPAPVLCTPLLASSKISLYHKSLLLSSALLSTRAFSLACGVSTVSSLPHVKKQSKTEEITTTALSSFPSTCISLKERVTVPFCPLTSHPLLTLPQWDFNSLKQWSPSADHGPILVCGVRSWVAQQEVSMGKWVKLHLCLQLLPITPITIVSQCINNNRWAKVHNKGNGLESSRNHPTHQHHANPWKYRLPQNHAQVPKSLAMAALRDLHETRTFLVSKSSGHLLDLPVFSAPIESDVVSVHPNNVPSCFLWSGFSSSMRVGPSTYDSWEFLLPIS